MGRWFLGLTWLFILGVAAYDTYFAWHYRAVFDAWEINPLARHVASHLGVGAVFGLKAMAVALSVAVTLACHRCGRRTTGFLYTISLGGVHLFLAVHYIIGYLQA
jgi:hypothetical protein